MWELGEVIRQQALQRFLILIPKQLNYADLQRLAEAQGVLLPSPPPQYDRLHWSIGNLPFLALIYFDMMGDAHWVRLPKVSYWERHTPRYPLVPVLWKALEPVFSQLDIPWRPWPKSILRRIAFGFLVIVLALLLVTVLLDLARK